MFEGFCGQPDRLKKPAHKLRDLWVCFVDSAGLRVGCVHRTPSSASKEQQYDANSSYAQRINNEY